MNPGSPAPQASVLIQTSRFNAKTPPSQTVSRLRAHTNGILHEDQIINTLLNLKKKGLYDKTIKTTSQELNQLGRNTDLMNPKEVLTYIANHKVANSSKQKLVNCYAYFCKTNGIIFEKPKYKYEETIPIIPTKENVFWGY